MEYLPANSPADRLYYKAAEAITSGDNAALDRLLAQDGVARNCPRHSKSLLHHAIAQGNEAACEKILPLHGDVNVADDTGSTPLMAARLACNLRLVELLLDHRADPSLQNKAGQTAYDLFLMAARFKSVKTREEKEDLSLIATLLSAGLPPRRPPPTRTPPQNPQRSLNF